MSEVVLVYPYYYGKVRDRSIFKFPPLGLGYIASSLLQKGIEVDLIDGTFAAPNRLIELIRKIKPTLVGVYAMVTLEQGALELASAVRDSCRLLVAGGPYPSVLPRLFLPSFDLVAVGEGEESFVELTLAVSARKNPRDVPGYAYLDGNSLEYSPPRVRIEKLDGIPFPARFLFNNSATSMITSRGCPYRCGFCSKPVFGDAYLERSPVNVVKEIEETISFGYDRVWMADDCFTLNKDRVKAICETILNRDLRIEWECLCRVDGLTDELLKLMREAGCVRILFGLESGNNNILKLMRKNTTVESIGQALDLTRKAGIQTGGFFILGYPGETNETILDTVNYSSKLSLDYLSYTVPYPLPGTELFETVKHRMKNTLWVTPRSHTLLYKSDFSLIKLKLYMAKGKAQHWLRSRQRKIIRAFEPLFRRLTDAIFLIDLFKFFRH